MFVKSLLKNKNQKEYFNYQLYFNSKLRREGKKQVSQILTTMAAKWPDMPYQNYKQRKRNTLCTDVAVNFIKRYKEVEKFWDRLKMKDKHFDLYKHKYSKQILIERRFTQVVFGKKFTISTVLKDGFPDSAHPQVSARYYNRPLSKTAYHHTYSGTFFHRHLDFTINTTYLKAKDFRFRYQTQMVPGKHTFTLYYLPL